jgi:hypothetical protein
VSDPPIDITKHPRFRGPQPDDEEKRREVERKRQQRADTRAERGRRAFAALSARREKLTRADREAIARSLFSEIDNYCKRTGEAKYLLVKKAGLTDANSTKVLERLVLKPGKPYRSDLYATASKYADLIRALADGESIDELAYRVLSGTSFYPRQADAPFPAMNEAQLIFDALVAAANRVDDEFQIFAQCLDVARLRDEVESTYWQRHTKSREVGLDLLNWHKMVSEMKLLPHSWPGTTRALSEDSGLWWPVAVWRLVSPWVLTEDAGLEEPSPSNAFWADAVSVDDPFSAKVRSEPDFFYFPHIYLGPALCVDLTPEYYFVDELPSLPMPQIQWDETTHQYALRDHGPEYFDDLCPKAAQWLVLYPDPHVKKLVPMIYAMGDWVGAELTPLTAQLIADFGDTKHWQYFGKDAITLLDRLKALTGYRTGKFDVYEGWRETAARFHWNPVLRSHPNIVDDIRYHQHLQQWLRAGRHRLDRDDEED